MHEGRPAGGDDLVRRAAEDWERQRILQGGRLGPAAGPANRWQHQRFQPLPYVDWAGRSAEAWERQRLQQRRLPNE